MRKPNKLQLAIDDHSRLLVKTMTDEIPCTENILDGGSLLHRVPWTKRETYGTISERYADFTINHYGTASVVFDGYSGAPSIKDNTHQRRCQSVSPVIRITANTEFSGKKEEVLSRASNKQSQILMISNLLKQRNCQAIKAHADIDIIKAAVDASKTLSTTSIVEDTDFLILPLHYANVKNKPLCFRSDKHAKSQNRV